MLTFSVETKGGARCQNIGLMQILNQSYIRKHSYLDKWYMYHSWLASIKHTDTWSMPQGGARGQKNLIFYFYKNHVYSTNRYYFRLTFSLCVFT